MNHTGLAKKVLAVTDKAGFNAAGTKVGYLLVALDLTNQGIDGSTVFVSNVDKKQRASLLRACADMAEREALKGENE